MPPTHTALYQKLKILRPPSLAESKLNNLLFRFLFSTKILTVLAVASREAAEADALVRVQLRVAASAVVARLLGAGVALERGHVAGAQDVLLSEDGRSHQDDLGQSRAAER